MQPEGSVETDGSDELTPREVRRAFAGAQTEMGVGEDGRGATSGGGGGMGSGVAGAMPIGALIGAALFLMGLPACCPKTKKTDWNSRQKTGLEI